MTIADDSALAGQSSSSFRAVGYVWLEATKLVSDLAIAGCHFDCFLFSYFFPLPRIAEGSNLKRMLFLFLVAVI